MNVTWEASKALLAALIRAALATFGTFLVTKGWVDARLADAFVSEATGYIVGFLVIVIAAVWEFLRTRYNLAAILNALYVQPPETDRQEAARFAEVTKDAKVISKL